MHKKLAADLTSLAHSILQLKNKEDVFVLKQKAYEVYEKLALLSYIEEYINTTPNASETKEALIKKPENAFKEVAKSEEKEVVVEKIIQEETIVSVKEATEEKVDTKVEIADSKQEEILEQPFDELEALFTVEDTFLEEEQESEQKNTGNRKTLDEELFEIGRAHV